MDSFFEEYASSVVELVFLYMVYRILYAVLEVVWRIGL